MHYEVADLKGAARLEEDGCLGQFAQLFGAAFIGTFVHINGDFERTGDDSCAFAVVAVLVAHQDGLDAFLGYSERFQGCKNGFAGQACIDEDGRFSGSYEYRIAL